MAERAASRLARAVQVLPAGDLSAVAAYDAIWANARLLHVPLHDLAGVLTRINIALKPGGYFYASYKSGQSEGRDHFGRYYNYPSAQELDSLYRKSAWRSLDLIEELGGGYDAVSTTWLQVTAVKP